ncbi:MAG: DEAD/DEAH box helicase family protein, partial [Thiotrichaceae bacterium]|nr:DEAD/DEAH box helicase family protein [Thiotrichaceae bacterium]
MTALQTLLDYYDRNALSTVHKGKQFECLMQEYLKANPLYQYQNVWLWDEWEGRNNWEGHKGVDKGIDLVAIDEIGEYVAVQCKFYNSLYTLQKKDIDSFFTESGKQPFAKRLIISTTDLWSKHADSALDKQHTPVSRLGISDLENSPIDWSQCDYRQLNKLALKPKKQLRPHQDKALDKVLEGFKTADRGKLIMACGTGKTFTSLKIAERIAGQSGFILFLVPSISLLSQTLREWSAEVSPDIGFNSLAVCSDSKVNKTEDIHVYDIGYPATTDPSKLAEYLSLCKSRDNGLTVIFSTYQSIQIISEAQQQYNIPEFDLILCDEAHRTTGATFVGNEESKFVRVHDQDYIQAKKRLYMTATPRLYDDSVKTKAQQADTILCSMDDESLYGHEFHRLGFGEAVNDNLLSDYKVMILAVDEGYVSRVFQDQLADDENTLNLEDAAKITGCWNGLSKRMAKDMDDNLLAGDSHPMRRAVAFCKDIKTSKEITELFKQVVDEYHKTHDEANLLHCESDHVDGTFNALKRHQLLDWLKAESEDNTCRILTNARCLSEGVDVPALDAVMFLNPRNSQVDVVQSVGRVMRKAEGKQYGYIILPIGIPAGVAPEQALQDQKKYKVVWDILQALRAHDDRFNATINKLELNTHKPDNIQVIGVTGKRSDDDGGALDGQDHSVQHSLQFPDIEEWRNAIYAKIVAKCGERFYWETWAKDIAQIAERHITRIKGLLDTQPQHKATFDSFLTTLQNTLNPAINQGDAIEMLAQHLITKPVFDALFDDYDFAAHNPVSKAMQSMLDTLQEQALDKETETLEKFYDSVRVRAQKVDNAAAKQKIIVELYDKFFRTAFPRMAERLGIVYTPIEVVDFIIQSVDVALKQEFNQGLTDKDVHILDPFTGTGTFMVRLIQSGLIKPSDLARKFKHELHANELVLLAYYIAAVNIEAAYHGAIGGDYVPFEGIVLTDTFQMTEGNKGIQGLKDNMLPENSKRAKHQNQQAIQVIIGNPPYSAGQGSENDNNKNVKYTDLDNSIRETYADKSTATNKNSLYDSYIRAIRWASNRIQDKGVIGFVSNGSFIDSNVTDGLRQCLSEEFSAIYCFNLRGNARTQGEQRRKEKGNVFGEGSRSNIVITLLVKNPSSQAKQATIYYHDIGDYLS